ncbi:MAG: 16S rRNA (cytosine(1402)-N(4))-methyltransferase RsmH [Thermogemmatispora sp.]|uniref:16S rRNA (cytosine(1402)-N(4))-methyltransferase RsmH n=1 Tax=Thermogemmatispora sp. TaxID=1968838 RepID=UPI0026311B81|nr:16S rRNA (cytosine(1402)-N(4))-methyltransferase RsmH [Thermogemmatispora sp.]MBX5456440.1 16S rRNA (cytosine(1402)-N(4))-methyltransferase RsmH [Thermogemmatispora sp.]
MELRHMPVLLEEVVRFLQPQAGGHYIDGTLGDGGHTEAILERSAPDGRVLGIDLDPEALDRVAQRLSRYVKSGRLLLAQGNFADLERIAAAHAFGPVQGILLDLGFSSLQLSDPRRGLSFAVEGPLDMRFDPAQSLSAADLVNQADEQELADIFYRYGEERHARQIARRIVREREQAPITSTRRLAEIVTAAIAAARQRPPRDGIHPATRVFMALRIAVNRELENLERALPQMLNLLSRGSGASGERGLAGRMVVIAFHSLEDRIVKDFMKREATDCLCPPRTPVCVCGHRARLRLLTPKPVWPTAEEVSANPRSRSARLRAAERLADSPA